MDRSSRPAKANPKDEIRDRILQYFYDRNERATSRFGKKGSAVKISDVKKELKALHSLSQQEVQANLTYLIDRGWINVVEQEKTVTTSRGTTMPSVVAFYEVSAEGIDKIEGGSEFERPERYAGININATGQNVITLGDGNVVNANFQQLFKDLTTLKEGIAASDQLPEEEKFDVSVDIETLKDQLAKNHPDPEITKRLWPSIDKAAKLAGLTETAISIGTAIGQLL